MIISCEKYSILTAYFCGIHRNIHVDNRLILDLNHRNEYLTNLVLKEMPHVRY